DPIAHPDYVHARQVNSDRDNLPPRRRCRPDEEYSSDTRPSTESFPAIFKTKQFPVKPITPDEAVLQLELIGHDFFVFRNAESLEVNVVYRRRDGNHGLIEPQ